MVWDLHGPLMHPIESFQTPDGQVAERVQTQSKDDMGFSFPALGSSQVEAPFLPKVQGMGDTSNFESYPESVEDDSPPLSAEENALFEELENF